MFIVPLIYRPKEFPYALSYRKIEDQYQELKSLMKEVSSEKERQEMLKLFLSGYISIALMRMVIQKKGHFDRKFYTASYRSSSSSGSGSGSSFSGGGGSFGGGGASGGWLRSLAREGVPPGWGKMMPGLRPYAHPEKNSRQTR